MAINLNIRVRSPPPPPYSYQNSFPDRSTLNIQQLKIMDLSKADIDNYIHKIMLNTTLRVCDH